MKTICAKAQAVLTFLPLMFVVCLASFYYGGRVDAYIMHKLDHTAFARFLDTTNFLIALVILLVTYMLCVALVLSPYLLAIWGLREAAGLRWVEEEYEATRMVKVEEKYTAKRMVLRPRQQLA